jgi:purine catabolism regulator
VGLTVEEASSIGGMRQGRLLAGKKGLSNIVSHVNVLEAVTEDDDHWDIRNHLFLTTFNFAGNDTNRQVELIRQLSRGGCVALVFQVGLVAPLRPAVLHAADELSLPLFELPLSVDYADILTPLICAVQGENGYLVREASLVQQQLLKEMLNGGGLGSLVSLLAGHFRRSVAVVDNRGVLYASSDDWVGADVIAHLPQYVAPAKTIVRRSAWITALARRPDIPIEGFLIVNSPDAVAPSALEAAMLDQGAALLTLELAKLRVADETYAEPFRTWMRYLLAGDFETARTFASAQSLDLASLRVAVMFQRVQPSQESWTSGDPETRSAWQAIYATEEKPLVFEWEGRLLWLPSIAPSASLAEVRIAVDTKVRRVWDRLAGNGIAVWRIASGAPVGSANLLHQSVQDAEAVFALDTPEHVNGPVAYDDVAIDILFRQIVSQPAAQRWVESVVGRLASHDLLQRSELVLTLETFFDSGQSHKLAAHRLGIHPKTLKYRLDKIEQIMGGLPIRDGSQFALHLALKLSRSSG